MRITLYKLREIKKTVQRSAWTTSHRLFELSFEKSLRHLKIARLHYTAIRGARTLKCTDDNGPGKAIGLTSCRSIEYSQLRIGGGCVSWQATCFQPPLRVKITELIEYKSAGRRWRLARFL